MARPISLNEIRSKSARFVSDWQDEPGEEKQQAHEFVRELLGSFGVTGRKSALYEERAKRSSTGRHGYIDALIPGLCIIEMKSKGRNLEEAERQALDYMGELSDAETPRWIITSDFHNFRVLDLEAPRGQNLEKFSLPELPQNAEALGFLAGYQKRSFGSKQQAQASIKAAQLMAKLYESLEGSGYDDHEASIFMVRTLFALYADDSGVWERDLFYEFIETRTSEDGADLGGQLSVLYQVMNRPEEKRQRNTDEIILRFPYVNGGVFSEPISIPAFDRTMREVLLECCAFNWSAISPAIFGSLFQAVKDKEARRDLGEHYTTETNILKTIGPLFLDELQEEFAHQAHSKSGLKKLRTNLGDLKFLDPACGCGNFLVVAYREMRALELRILLRLKELGEAVEFSTLFFTKESLAVTLENFAGIEIEEWPARIAETAMHLVDHQANQAMELALGQAPDPLPLDKIRTIHVGNALRIDWKTIVRPDADVRIAGNPPFIGQFTKTVDQKADLQEVWGTQYDGYLDYVSGWYKKASDYFEHIRGGRFAFVSTNSITQGQPVPALFRPLQEAGWRIRFAHQTFSWASEAPGAASVHCVIVGFDKRERSAAHLYKYDDVKAEPMRSPATNINAYLIDGPEIFVGKRSKPLSGELPPVIYGSKPTDGGHLIVEADDVEEAKLDPIASKYLRKYQGSKEIMHSLDRWCFWLDGADPRDINNSPLIKERVMRVREFRLASKKAATRVLADSPTLFAERRHLEGPYLAVPSVVSETRKYFVADRSLNDTVTSNLSFTASDPDGFLFAVISSSMFIAWQKAVGGRLKSDLRFSNTVVWNNLPLPVISPKQRDSIISAGQKILEAREKWAGRSLAELYSPLAMPAELLAAHVALDRIVDKAFGAKNAAPSDEERTRILFARYAELAQAN